MEERDLGGNLSSAVLRDGLVYRTAGPWTSSVHALLRFLDESGFGHAPHARGYDEQGREVLEYIDGESKSSPPYPPVVTTEEALIQAGVLLRALHDVTLKFDEPSFARWQVGVPDPGPKEVICHGDWTPYNAVFRDSELIAMVDWDFAGPGSRVWDLAWAAFMWVPLCAESEAAAAGWPRPFDQVHRLRLFCEAYGWTERRELLDAVERRVTGNAEGIRRRVGRGEPGFVAMAETGHIGWYEKAAEYVINQRGAWS